MQGRGGGAGPGVSSPANEEGRELQPHAVPNCLMPLLTYLRFLVRLPALHEGSEFRVHLCQLLWRHSRVEQAGAQDLPAGSAIGQAGEGEGSEGDGRLGKRKRGG